MDCSCIRGNFNFFIKAVDANNWRYTDISDWMDEENYNIPTSYDIQVSMYGGSPKTVSVTPLETTNISASSLGGTECLLDGIYCISTENCGTTYTRYYAHTWRLECCLDDLTQKRGLDDDISDITNIENLIESIKSNVNIGKVKKAAELYKYVDTILKQKNCNC